MPQIFHRSYNVISKLTIYGAVFILAGLGAAAALWVRSAYATNAGITRNHGYMVFDTLFAIDPKYKSQPQMVGDYSKSPDELLYRFTLRDGLKFHDGEPVRGTDCVTSLKRWMVRDAFGQSLAIAVDKMEAGDDKSFTIRLKEPFPMLLDALAKAGVVVDFDVELESLSLPKLPCEKCDGDTTFCPADARSMKPGEVAGGIKLVPERSLQIGVSMDDPNNGRVFDTVANLREALKSPGRTETTLIPLDGQISLEIKATVVPTSPEKAKTAGKKDEAPAAKR